MVELGVRAIIKDKNGNILLLKNARGLHKNKWVLPGGRVDNKEDASDAIIREIREELGVEFKPLFYCYSQDLVSSKEMDYLTLFFVGDAGEGILLKSDEVAEFKYFNIKDIDNIEMAFGHKEVIRKYIAKEDII
jgi:8-oxo-dGTP diphosphatase